MLRFAHRQRRRATHAGPQGLGGRGRRRHFRRVDTLRLPVDNIRSATRRHYGRGARRRAVGQEGSFRASRQASVEGCASTKSRPVPIEIPLTKVFGGSSYSVVSRCTVVTRMDTDNGLVSELDEATTAGIGARSCGLSIENADAAGDRREHLRGRRHLASSSSPALPTTIASSDGGHRLHRCGSGIWWARRRGWMPRCSAATRTADHLDRQVLRGTEDPGRPRPRDGGLREVGMAGCRGRSAGSLLRRMPGVSRPHARRSAPDFLSRWTPTAAGRSTTPSVSPGSLSHSASAWFEEPLPLARRRALMSEFGIRQTSRSKADSPG